MSKARCRKWKECLVHNCVAKLEHNYTPVCDVPCNIKGGIHGMTCITTEEENKMKCPKCGKERVQLSHEEWGPYCATQKPNPSPRDIFQHIKTRCELSSYREFLREYGGLEPDRPIENLTIKEIKESHPDWYKWLCDKSLVPREKVKREAWVNFYIQDGFPGVDRLLSYRTEKEASAIADKLKGYVKTILLHEWDE